MPKALSVHSELLEELILVQQLLLLNRCWTERHLSLQMHIVMQPEKLLTETIVVRGTPLIRTLGKCTTV
jgi:hypothetical protein